MKPFLYAVPVIAVCCMPADAGTPALVPPHLKNECRVDQAGKGREEFLFGGTAPAVVSSQAGSLIYETRYMEARLAGELHAYLQNPDTPERVLQFELSRKLGMAQPSQRVVMASRDGAGIGFQWNLLSLAQKTALKKGASDAIGMERLAYLRGDQSRETVDKMNFRLRPDGRPLGPLINSLPWYVGVPDAGLTEPQHMGYPAFRTANLNRRAMAYVASNDGMLHGFDAHEGTPLFSYLPDYLLERAVQTTLPGARLTALFDGMPFAGDADMGEGNRRNWRTMLFAPFGRGGHGLVALDVTNPGSHASDRQKDDYIGSEKNALQFVKWELTDRHDKDLGSIISRPHKNLEGGARQVVQLQNGRWVVLFGNGYDSDAPDGHAGAGDAVLFMVSVKGPSGAGKTWSAADLIKITTRDATPQGGPGAGPANGLGLPFPIDTNNDGKVDLVYAADYKGNVWKFVDKDKNGIWSLAYRMPFYTAPSSSQPISGGLTVRAHPAGGYMVVFGTGQFIEAKDARLTGQAQRVVGVWDRPAAKTGLSARPRMLRQRIDHVSRDGKYRLTSDTRITNWADYDGWYLELPADEKVIDNVSIRAGGLAVFNTVYLVPDGTGCGGKTAGFAMTLDALDGSAPVADGVNDAHDRLFVVLDATGFVLRIATADDLRSPPRDGRIVARGPSGIRLDGSSGFGSEQRSATGARRYVSVDCGSPGAVQGAGGDCHAVTSEPHGARYGRINWREVWRNQ